MTLSYLVDRRNIHNTPWNSERDAVLAQMWADGYTASEIAKELNGAVSRCAVIGRAHRLKLPARAARQKQRKAERKPRAPRKWKPRSVPARNDERQTVGATVSARHAPAMRMLTLLQLKPTSCRWPIGDGPFLFCSTDVAEGRAYCPYHCARAYVRSGR